MRYSKSEICASNHVHRDAIFARSRAHRYAVRFALQKQKQKRARKYQKKCVQTNEKWAVFLKCYRSTYIDNGS